ncbi:hypothetical protein RRG08_046049 [Elysia crispata]|uniref:Uncharacterized protein n=1 Tax=Elysia crispata TaxID=231223 RepID=A0AAE1A8J5_9GAST|nr:hypothetical protein RRG08_046049 [Elysia crispata]
MKRIVKCVRQDGRIDDYGRFVFFYARGMKISRRPMPVSFSYLQIETDVLNTPSGKTPDLDLRTKTSFSVSIAQGNKIRSVDSKATSLTDSASGFCIRGIPPRVMRHASGFCIRGIPPRVMRHASGFCIRGIPPRVMRHASGFCIRGIPPRVMRHASGFCIWGIPPRVMRHASGFCIRGIPPRVMRHASLMSGGDKLLAIWRLGLELQLHGLFCISDMWSCDTSIASFCNCFSTYGWRKLMYIART